MSGWPRCWVLCGAPVCAGFRMSRACCSPWCSQGLGGLERQWAHGEVSKHKWDPKSQIRLVLSAPLAHITHPENKHISHLILTLQKFWKSTFYACTPGRCQQALGCLSLLWEQQNLAKALFC